MGEQVLITFGAIFSGFIMSCCFLTETTEEYQQNPGGHVLNGSVLGDVFGHFTVRCATYTRLWLCEHHQIHILAH